MRTSWSQVEFLPCSWAPYSLQLNAYVPHHGSHIGRWHKSLTGMGEALESVSSTLSVFSYSNMTVLAYMALEAIWYVSDFLGLCRVCLRCWCGAFNHWYGCWCGVCCWYRGGPRIVEWYWSCGENDADMETQKAIDSEQSRCESTKDKAPKVELVEFLILY